MAQINDNGGVTLKLDYDIDQVPKKLKSLQDQSNAALKSIKKSASMSETATSGSVGFDKTIFKGDKTIQRLNSRISSAKAKIEELTESRQQYTEMYGVGGQYPDERKLAMALLELEKRYANQVNILRQAQKQLRSYKKTLKSKELLNEKRKEQRELDRLALNERKEEERQERRQKRALEKQKEAQAKLEEQNKNLVKSFRLTDYAAMAFYRRLLRYGIKAFTALTKAGSQYDETNSRFIRILGKYADQAERYATRIANAFGRNLTEVKGNMTSIYTMLKNANIQGDKAVVMAANLTAISNELASVWDVDVSEAIDAVMSGLQGLPKGMKKFGSQLTQTEIKEYLQEAGIISKDFTGSFSGADRVLATYLKIMRDTGYAIGDFGDTQKSVANQVRIFRSSFQGLLQTLGSMLNKVLSPLLSVVNGFLKGINSIVNSLSKMPGWLKYITGSLVAINILLPVCFALSMFASKGVEVYRKQIEKLDAWLEVATGSQLKFAKAVKWATLNMGKIISFVTVLILFISAIAKSFDKVDKNAQDANNSLEDVIDKAKEYKKLIAGFDDVNVASFKDSTDETDLSKLGNLGLDSINEAFDKLVGTNDILEKISQTIDDLIEPITVMLGMLTVLKGLNLLADFVKGLGWLKKSSLEIGVLVAGLGLIVGVIQKVQDVLNSSEPAWYKITMAVFGLITAVSTLATVLGILTHNYGLALRGAQGIALGAIGMAGSSGINALTKKSTPQMATGGVVTKPTLATVGEGKYNEAVVPLGQSPQFSSMKSDIADAVVQGLSNVNLNKDQPININISLDESYIYRAYNRQAKLYGGKQ